MKLLPIGVTDFATLRQQDYLYVDKTKYIYELLKEKKLCFLFRPRRFGKSLLLSTLKAVLQGRRELFDGLWINDSDYNWTPYPVIHFSMSDIDSDTVKGIEDGLINKIKSVAATEKLTVRNSKAPVQVFKSLLERLYRKYDRKVAVLIDEYDSPVFEHIMEPAFAAEIHKRLMNFYNVLKSEDDLRGFSLITGINKYAQTSVLTTLGDLNDLTFKKKYVNICGFTKEEFDAISPDYLGKILVNLKTYDTLEPTDTFSDLRKLIFNLYDGYSWDGITTVLNPWDILNVFDCMELSDFWTQSGHLPEFFSQFVKEKKISFNRSDDFETITENLNKIDFESKLKLTPFLFQMGYLTVKNVVKTSQGLSYLLDFPNAFVRKDIIPLIFSLKTIEFPIMVLRQSVNMLNSLVNLDVEGFQTSFEKFLSNFSYRKQEPHVVHDANYQVLFQIAMLLAGARADSFISKGNDADEDKFNFHYLADDGSHFVILVKHCPHKSKKGKKYLSNELKIRMEERARAAIDQIEKKKFTQPYRKFRNPIYKVAIVIGGRSKVLFVLKKEEQRKFFF
ncbi:MAG: AAA family ATPase [Deltaproteobacteria bacterium]|jgi:hypothetical protein|nr:AAA family ATPase [Deltaproteobacteria bacterium]